MRKEWKVKDPNTGYYFLLTHSQFDTMMKAINSQIESNKLMTKALVEQKRVELANLIIQGSFLGLAVYILYWVESRNIVSHLIHTLGG